LRNAFLLAIPILCLAPLCAEDAEAVKLPPHILTNQGVVALSDAGYDEDFLIDLIQSKQTRFDTSAEGLAYLAQHGLCEHVVRVIVARAQAHDSHAVTAAPIAPVATPVQGANRQFMVTPAMEGGVQMIPLAGTTWLHGNSFRLPSPQPSFQLVRERHGLFGHRWYIVPMQPYIPAPQPVAEPLVTAQPVSLGHPPRF
jgi:hypothetical protein